VAYVAHHESPVAEGSLVIRFDSNVPDSQRAVLLEAAGISDWREIGVERFVVAVVREEEKDAVGAALAATTAVSAVSDDPIRMPMGGPSDPWYPDQWHPSGSALVKSGRRRMVRESRLPL
jgi:hypothetical protein